MAVRTEGVISASLIILVLVGSATGAVVGLLLDGIVGTRMLAVLSGLIATVGASIARYVLVFRGSGAGYEEAHIPMVLAVNAAIASIAGSLAAHDLSGYLGSPPPAALLGALAGLLSVTLMAMLMITYHHSPRPKG